MSRGSSAARGVLWMAATSVISQALSFLVFIILARIMEPDAFGLIALSLAVILVLAAGSGLGLEKLLVQLEAPGKTETDTAFFLSAIFGVALALALWLIAPTVAKLVASPELGSVMRALTLVVVLKALSVVPLGLMTRAFHFKAIALRSILALTAGGITGIAMAVNGYGVWALVAQEIVKASCSLLTLWLACGWKPGTSLSVKAGRGMLGVSLHMMGSEITRVTQLHIDRFLIGSFLGITSLGIYTIASKVNRVATIVLHDSLGRVGLPTFSRVRDDPIRLKQVYYQSQRIAAAATLPVFVLLIVTADGVVPLLLGPRWGASIPVLQALCLASCAGSIGVFNGPLLLAIGRADIVFRLSLFSALSGLLAFVIAIRWGILGISLAFALRAWMVLVLELFLCRHYCSIPTQPVWAGLAKQIQVLAIMVLVVVGIQALTAGWQPWPALFVSLLAGTVCYVTTISVTDPALALLLRRMPAILFPGKR